MAGSAHFSYDNLCRRPEAAAWWVFESHHKKSELSSKTYVWIRFLGRRTGSCTDCNSGLFWLSAHHDFPSLLSYPDP